jgi:excisionase family DNA binding protein
MTTALPRDVQHLSWAAEQLGVGVSTAYRLLALGKVPGAFRIGSQRRVSVPGSSPKCMGPCRTATCRD